ncbi:hypothetical protein DID96_29590 [Burkholderia sp. Bp8963]|uniref:hypothetical protein n=1 Tax=Burkholderia sp. Bp8963 TaxID=2184547 RepID=UPI000F590B27|nr:hypothetical protein [Burkholderia sp. Bp8963]RQS63552.1 hypothetical protein DID96_29590 [Burkholderia sp. Bp8963]
MGTSTANDQLQERQSAGRSKELKAESVEPRVASRTRPDEALDDHRVRESRELARLVRLSDELRRRSGEIAGTSALHQSKCLLVYSRLEAYRCSLAVLLRVRGYTIDAVGTLSALRPARRKRPYIAIVAYIEPALRGEARFINLVQRAALPLPVFVLSHELEKAHSGQNERSDTLTYVPSLDALTAELDCTIGQP